MIIEWNGMECVDPILESLINLVSDVSKNGRHIYEWNTIIQTILDTDFFWQYLNESGRLTNWRFGISECYQYIVFGHTFQCHWTRPIETICFRIDGCQIRKIYILSFRLISLLLRIITEQELSLLPPRADQPSWIDCNDGRSRSIISFRFTQYYRFLLISTHKMHETLKQWIVDLEDLFIQIFNAISIPRITNELE